MKSFRCGIVIISMVFGSSLLGAADVASGGRRNAAIVLDASPALSNACRPVLTSLLDLLRRERTGTEGKVLVTLYDGKMHRIYDGAIGDPVSGSGTILENCDSSGWLAAANDRADLASKILDAVGSEPSGTYSDVYFVSASVPPFTHIEDFYSGVTAQKAAALAEISRRFRLTGANFHLVRVNGTDPDPVLASLLNAGAFYVSTGGTNGLSIESSLAPSMNCLEVSVRERFGQFRREKKLTLTVVSRYPQSTVFALRGIVLSDVRRRGIYVMTNSANLLPSSTTFYLKPGQKTNVTVSVFPVGELKTGHYTAMMQWIFDAGVNVSPTCRPVAFKVGGLWWFWTLIACLAVLFKRYLFKLFRALENSKAGPLFAPVAKAYRKADYNLSSFRVKHAGLAGTLKTLSGDIDNAAVHLTGWTVDLFGTVWQVIKIAGIALLKFFSRFVLFFPLGFVFRKTGEGMLRLNEKISDIRMPKLRRKVSLKMDFKKVKKL